MPVRSIRKPLVCGLVFLFFYAGPADADPPPLVLPVTAIPHLVTALDRLNMTPRDLGFDKDAAEPHIALKHVRDMLNDPLQLPRMADTIGAAVAEESTSALWPLTRLLLETNTAVTAIHDSPDIPGEIHFLPAVTQLCAAAQTAAGLLCSAFEGVPMEDKAYAVASLFGGAYFLDDHPEFSARLTAAGIPSQTVARVREQMIAIDPEPAAMQYLAVVETVRLDLLISAAEHLDGALAALVHETENRQIDWPALPVSVETPAGIILIGTTNADHYAESALLIVDPGGDDVYTGSAGSANGLLGAAISLVLDIGGNDAYEGEGLLGPGAAVFGISLIHDSGGNDLYRAAYAGQACAAFGVAVLDDRGGDDIYRAQAVAQGAADTGVGILRDRGGNDLYELGLTGQGFAGVRGVGLLIDDSGNDSYLAGGIRTDYDRNDDRSLSLAQGFAIGMRPYAGGGVAALVDRRGNDIYEAEVYAQGVSYWYSAGFLLDMAGNDAYRLHQYGQGSGIHLSLGLLADAAGHDVYSGGILCQGSAHDFAVGMLVDREGSDTYTADYFSQGRAINTALALLIDLSGNDAYFARQNDRCQGIGHDGGYRECGSVSLLLDLSGDDRYSCGATNNAGLVRPEYGIVYDAEP